MVSSELVEFYHSYRVVIDMSPKHTLRNRSWLFLQIRYASILDRRDGSRALTPALNGFGPNLGIQFRLLEYLMTGECAVVAQPLT